MKLDFLFPHWWSHEGTAAHSCIDVPQSTKFIHRQESKLHLQPLESVELLFLIGSHLFIQHVSPIWPLHPPSSGARLPQTLWLPFLTPDLLPSRHWAPKSTFVHANLLILTFILICLKSESSPPRVMTYRNHWNPRTMKMRAMKTCTLEWISEGRVLTGGAAFDSQPSKGWLNKIRIVQSTHKLACVCVPQLLSLSFTRLCHCVIASLLLVGISLRLEPLMADCGEIELYLSSFILISHCIPPSQRSRPPMQPFSLLCFILQMIPWGWTGQLVLPPSEIFMWQNDI